MSHAVYEETPCDQCGGTGKQLITIPDVGSYEDDCYECDCGVPRL